MKETTGQRLATKSMKALEVFAVNSNDCDHDCTECDPCKGVKDHAVILVNAVSSITNWDRLEGIRHLVVPVVMAKQGVMNGILYTNEELKRFPAAWNGRMVPVSHPSDNEGTSITVNTPESVNQYNVGKIFNATYTEENGKGKLTAEIWLNEDLTNLKAPGLINDLLANKQIEVSTGLHGDYIFEGGTFEGSSYFAIITNFRPDHLAILLDEEGACSLADGCGLNTNSNQTKEGKNEMTKTKISFADWIKSKLGFAIVDNSEHGIAHNDIRESLRGLLKAKHQTDDNSVFIEEVFDDVVVYEIFSNGIATLFQLDYNISSNDQVSLANDIPVEVQRKTEFVPVSIAQDPLNINKETKTKEEDSLMNEDERKALIDKIIANAAVPFVEDNREVLQKMTDEQLNGFSGIVAPTTNADGKEGDETEDPKKETTVADPKDPKAKVEEKVTANSKDEASEPDIGKLMSQLDATIKSLPEMVTNAVKVEKETNDKAPIVAALVANEKCKFSEATLSAMPIDELKAYQSSIVPMSFAGGQGGNVVINADDDLQPAAMPELKFDVAN